MKRNLHLGILISGGGTTAASLIEAVQSNKIPNTRVSVVIASRPTARGLAKLQASNIPTQVVDPSRLKSQKDFGKKLLAVLKKYKVNFVSQNGWLPLTPLEVVTHFKKNIINQHPGTLDPAGALDFGGKGMFGDRVIASQLIFSYLTGQQFFIEASTHFVTNEFDKGDLIRTEKFPINKNNHHKTVAEILTNKKELVKDILAIHEKLLPLEHHNVIETIKLFAKAKVLGYKRDTKLVKYNQKKILEKSKEIGISLFPNG